MNRAHSSLTTNATSRARVGAGAAILLCLFLSLAHAEETETPVSSPDGKWEYRVIDDAPFIVKASSVEIAVTLPGGDSSSAAESGKVIWAPDSRRLVFNYRASLRYHTCAAYELVGSTWKALPDVEKEAVSVQNAIRKAIAQQVKRLGLPADAHERRIDDNLAGAALD